MKFNLFYIVIILILTVNNFVSANIFNFILSMYYSSSISVNYNLIDVVADHKYVYALAKTYLYKNTTVMRNYMLLKLHNNVIVKKVLISFNYTASSVKLLLVDNYLIAVFYYKNNLIMLKFNKDLNLIQTRKIILNDEILNVVFVKNYNFINEYFAIVVEFHNKFALFEFDSDYLTITQQKYYVLDSYLKIKDAFFNNNKFYVLVDFYSNSNVIVFDNYFNFLYVFVLYSNADNIFVVEKNYVAVDNKNNRLLLFDDNNYFYVVKFRDCKILYVSAYDSDVFVLCKNKNNNLIIAKFDSKLNLKYSKLLFVNKNVYDAKLFVLNNKVYVYLRTNVRRLYYFHKYAINYLADTDVKINKKMLYQNKKYMLLKQHLKIIKLSKEQFSMFYYLNIRENSFNKYTYSSYVSVNVFTLID